MAIYITRKGSLVDKQTGEELIIERTKICAPMVVSDIAPYKSPVTGEVIGGRSARREDLLKHGCVDARELGKSFGARKGVRSEKWAKRTGLPMIGRDI